MLITAADNPQIKAVAALKIKKYRQQEGLFLVEGLRNVAEALASDWQAEKLFYVSAALSRPEAEQLLAWAATQGVALIEVTEKVFARLSDTDTPQGIVAVLREPTVRLPALPQKEQEFYLVLDGIKDPGNMGTIIRTAAAAGIDAVLALEGCTDVYAPKVVRAAMGGIFRLPVLTGLTPASVAEWCAERRVELWSTAVAAAESIYTVPAAPKVAVVIGSEAEGVSTELAAGSVRKLSIPMPGGSESLNVAVAAGVLLFEFVRRGLAHKENNVL